MHRRAAFTIIELLVVVAIIAILSTLAVSIYRKAHLSGLQTECITNLRAIGSAISLYCGDHENDFPRTAHTDESESWIYTLQPYLGNFDETRICPADPRGRERRAAHGTSYVLNEYIAVPLTDPFGRIKESFAKRNSLPSLERTIIVMTGADGLDVGVSSDHTHSRNWRDWPTVLADIQPDRFHPGPAASDHTEGAANYLFADGHVETLTAQWLKSEIDAGRNPARPPE